mmetsp:Transcript_43186/g.107907  ORF Transcript_43186/g.107907 Transcript_43186/m.107907 type:complete len:92 (+) Transcript_43186:988-1263(+)
MRTPAGNDRLNPHTYTHTWFEGKLKMKALGQLESILTLYTPPHTIYVHVSQNRSPRILLAGSCLNGAALTPSLSLCSLYIRNINCPALRDR